MPRAKANPEPAVEDYTSSTGKTFRIEAWRSGAYTVFDGDKQVGGNPPEVNRGFGSPRYPSNRLQANALAAAKNWVEVFGIRPV